MAGDEECGAREGKGSARRRPIGSRSATSWSVVAEATTRKDRAKAEGKRCLRCGRLVSEELLTYENGEETARAGGREARRYKGGVAGSE